MLFFLSLTLKLQCAAGLLHGALLSLSHLSRSHGCQCHLDPMIPRLSSESQTCTTNCWQSSQNNHMFKIQLLTSIFHQNMILPPIYPIPNNGNSSRLVALVKNVWFSLILFLSYLLISEPKSWHWPVILLLTWFPVPPWLTSNYSPPCPICFSVRLLVWTSRNVLTSGSYNLFLIPLLCWQFITPFLLNSSP